MIPSIWSITLTVSDLDQSVHFYQDILGLKKKYQFRDYAGFDCGGVELGVKTWGKLEQIREGEPSIALSVKDLDLVYESLVANGVIFTQKPQDTKWGARVAAFKDPDGNTFQLTEIDWDRYFDVCSS